MSEVFISYASEDRARAKDIAEALEEQGWSVWWDRNIPPGKTFDEVISAALDTAKCVVVLWSGESVRSNWVKEEAAEGARREILVPVLIEEVTIPLGFRRIQAASLVGWKKGTKNSDFQLLLDAVAQTLGVDLDAHSSQGGEDSNRAAFETPSALSKEQPLKERGTFSRVIAGLATFFGFLVAGWLAGILISESAGRSQAAGFIGAVPLWLAGLWLSYRVWKRAGR